MIKLIFKMCWTSIILIGLVGCVKNETESTDFDLRVNESVKYISLSIGTSKEYKVDSVLYRQGKFLDSTSSFIKEVIQEKFTDSLGEIFSVRRFWKKKMTDPWKPITTATERIVQLKYIRNEDNHHIIHLVLPFVLNETWNGLGLVQTNQIYNVEGESVQIFDGWESFKLTGVDKAETIGGKSYGAVATVLQSDEEDILAKRYSLEKYAKGKGLVYKEQIVYDCNNTINQCTNNTLPWPKRTTKGYAVKLTLIN